MASGHDGEHEEHERSNNLGTMKYQIRKSFQVQLQYSAGTIHLCDGGEPGLGWAVIIHSLHL